MPVIPLHFQDANFRSVLVEKGAEGSKEAHWVAVGMPRFSPSLLMVPFYLYRRDARSGEIKGPCGSGVFINVPPRDARLQPHVYAVTTYHGAVQAGASIIGFNVMNPDRPNETGIGARFQHSRRTLPFEPHEWKFIPGGDDVAAIDVTDSFDKFDLVASIGPHSLITRSFLRNRSISPGEDGFMLGLFRSNPGAEYNLPAARFGNLSQLADDMNPVEQGHGIVRPSHVFDMHSRPGFSGSPVFIYRTANNDLANVGVVGWHVEETIIKGQFLMLLGIHSGQFRETTEFEKAEAYGSPQPIVEGDKIEIPSSMTIVVPAWEIAKLLDQPHFVEQREMREKKGPKPKVRPEVVKAEPGDANPTHKEDFTSLLNAAATKRPKAG